MVIYISLFIEINQIMLLSPQSSASAVVDVISALAAAPQERDRASPLAVCRFRWESELQSLQLAAQRVQFPFQGEHDDG